MNPSAGCHVTTPTERPEPIAVRGRAAAVCLLLLVCLLTALPLRADDAAPLDFTLKSIDGDNLRLLDYRGSVVILSFFDGRCRDCEQQLRALDELQRRYNELGLRVLGITDPNNERAAKLSEKLKLSFPILLDRDQLSRRQVDANTLMPALVLVDKDGRQRYLHPDYRDADELKYESELRQLLNEWQ